MERCGREGHWHRPGVAACLPATRSINALANIHAMSVCKGAFGGEVCVTGGEVLVETVELPPPLQLVPQHLPCNLNATFINKEFKA